MKECPKCHNKVPDAVPFCHCGYEFPMFVEDISHHVTERLPAARISNDAIPEWWRRFFVLCTVGTLCESPYWILSGLIQMDVSANAGGQHLDLPLSIFSLVGGLILFGASVYTLDTTKYFRVWYHLSLQEKVVAAIPILFMVFTILTFCVGVMVASRCSGPQCG